LTDAEYEELTRKRGLASMSAYIKAVIFGGAGQSREDVPGVRDVPVVERGVDPPARPAAKSAKDELAEAVASRTRHPVGHQCLECMQAERFFRAMRKEEGL
jgi:hypothetical protein